MSVKDELQDIIFGNEQIGRGSQLKKNQSFPGGYAKAGIPIEKQQHFTGEETAALFGEHIKAFSVKLKVFYFLSNQN